MPEITLEHIRQAAIRARGAADLRDADLTDAILTDAWVTIGNVKRRIN